MPDSIFCQVLISLFFMSLHSCLCFAQKLPARLLFSVGKTTQFCNAMVCTVQCVCVCVCMCVCVCACVRACVCVCMVKKKYIKKWNCRWPKTATGSCVVQDQAPQQWSIRSALQPDRWCNSGTSNMRMRM